MLGITIRLGASKDQIVSTATGHVFADRYEARNRVKSVQAYGNHKRKALNADGTTDKSFPHGMHYKAAPDHSYLKSVHAVVMDAAKRWLRRAA